MILIKSLRLFHAVSYVLVSAQLLFYLLILNKALQQISIENFLEQRKVIDPIVTGNFRILYYCALILSVVGVFFSNGDYRSVAFITACITLLCIVLDVTIALVFNAPINTMVNKYTPEMGTLVNWESVRIEWLGFVRYRGIIILIGVLSLLTGLVFGRNE